MKPTAVLGFGLLLLLFLPGVTASDEPEPFNQIPDKQTLLQLVRIDPLPESALRPDQLDLHGSTWLPANLAEWENDELLRWIRNDWLYEIPRPELDRFIEAIRDAHESHLLATDSRAVILRDDHGALLAQTGSDSRKDYLSWQVDLNASMEELLQQWEREMQVVCQELLASLEHLDLPQAQATVQSTLAEYRAEVHREFERLYRQAESQFIRLRLERSSGNETEPESDATPHELARELIASTESQLQDSAALSETDPRMISLHQQLPVELDTETWQADFCKAFEEGIAAWNRAEQDFLDERLRWEVDARGLYAESEQAWQEAYLQFEQTRQRWIEEMEVRLQEGLSYWDQAESEFLGQYDREMAELTAYSNEELDRLNQELGRLLSLYGQNVDLIEAAEHSIELLQSEIAGLKESNDPQRLETLQLLQEELAYWGGTNGQAGVLGQCRQTLAEAQAALIALEEPIREFGSQLYGGTELEREIGRLESELLYLSEQLDSGQDEGAATGIMDQRREAYERIATALDTLRRLDPSTRLDSGYLGLKDRELSLLNAQQTILQAFQSLEQSAREIAGDLAANTLALQTSIDRIFDFDPDLDCMRTVEVPDIGALTDFSSMEDSAFAGAVEAYFSGEPEGLSERLSRDAAIWLSAMAGLEGGCQAALRAFGLAYYYDVQVQSDLNMEGMPNIDIPILHNPNLSVLVDEYLELGPYKQMNLFYDGKIITYKTVYPENKLLPEDYLAVEAQRALGDVQSDPETARLYAYFKAMLASGHFSPGADFIRDDCTDLAYNYVESKAMALQHKWETKWWLFKWRQADEIASLRSKIAAAYASGAGDRRVIASGAEDILQGLTDRQELIHKLDFLTAPPGSGGTDKESFLSALGTVIPLDDAFSTLMQQALGGLRAAELSDNLSTLEAIGIILKEDLFQTQDAILASVDALSAEHERNLETYLECLYDPDSSGSELMRAASRLFSDPAFTRDAYLDAELHYANLIQSSTLEGRCRWLSELAADLYGLMEHRLVLLQERVQQDLQLELRRIRDERFAWEATVSELLSRGLEEWTSGAKRIADSHQRWLRAFVNEYGEKEQMWDGKYVLFCRNRDRWVTNSTNSVVSAAAQSIARLMDLDADRLIGEIQIIAVPGMTAAAPQLDILVGRAIPGRELDDLLTDALSSDFSSDFSGCARSLERALQLASIRPPGSAELQVRRPAAEIVGEISGRIGFATALQMRVCIEETEEAIHEQIAEANRILEDNLFALLRSGGYRRSGSEFNRSSVIDKTLIGGLEEERQSVPAYRYFIAPDFDAGVDLSRASLEGRSWDYIQEVTVRARENLNKYLELIFGRDEESREGWDWQGINAEFKAFFDAQTASFRGAEGFHRNDGRYYDVDGLFPYHVGYEPVMRSDDPEEVQEPGFGELGIIMEAFYRNEARQARGLSMLGVPWYNLRMWDDDTDNDGEADGWLEAPSARDAVNLAVSIAASATGNVWVAAALNLADDAVFTMADVSSGFVGLEQGMLSFGKQALASTATAGTGVGFDALEGALGAFAEEGVCKALLQGVESATRRVAGATVNAFQLDPDGELMFNTSLYKKTLIGRQALRSYLAELSGTVAGSFLEGNLTGFSAEHMKDVMGVSHLAAGLTQASLEYALTGQTILNLADFSMFNLNANNRTLSGGFIELQIGADQPRFALGHGGVDLSLSAVAGATSGMDTWIESMRIRRYDRFGTWEIADGYGGYGSVGTSMRSLYSFSDNQGRQLYEDLLDGDTMLLVGFTGTAGQTQLAGDGLQIQMATLGDYRDRNSRLMSGVVLQHEAHRDGVITDAAGQKLETREAVLAHTDMALKIAGEYGFSFIENDPALLRDVVASRIAKVMGDEFFTAYVDQLYESEQADLYSIEKWSGKAIGTNRRHNSYYVIKLEQDTEDAAKHDVRSTIGPVFFLIDKIHNLFSNKDRVQMYKPLYDIVDNQDYFGAFKILYGTGADVIGNSADVVGMIDDVITAYEIVKNTEVPGSGALNTVSVGLETIDQLVSGIAAGFNTVIEKYFADYWWMSGVPNFATTESDLEDLTRFMFSHFVEGTRIKDMLHLYRVYVDESPSILFKHYETNPEWKIRIDSFGTQYMHVPYFNDGLIGITNGYEEVLWDYDRWNELNTWWNKNIK